MKKFIIFSILLFLSFNILLSASVFAVTNFKEGIYQLSNFNVSPNNRYTIQNISPSQSVYVLLFDENQLQIQSIRLKPNSENYSLLPLQPNYRLIVVGNGEVIIQ
ncbi:hypothetical protein CDLVIII_3865 [Clostridium sp. DL-VIII]|uniref:hypothetical protein n=1 Tax=Clostridium sp. DL-VIII TaxID=641107 RepID=UPI00023B0073|nr:hypothetical protein [Clostridium sp. DL-VIII]EHJ00410.1 hypothetical protein CDLVIII_3865 [Clostridium sp. DL-VIII]